MPKADLTGQRFHRLIAIKSLGSDKVHNVIWECLCDCGRTCTAIGSALLRGTKKSCGCMAKLREGMTMRAQDGYILVKTFIHPFRNSHDFIPQHRLVMEQSLGRYLDPKEIVHHKNQIKDDNRIENLQLCKDDAEHRKVHAPLALCSQCGKTHSIHKTCDFIVKRRYFEAHTIPCPHCGKKIEGRLKAEDGLALCFTCRNKKGKPRRNRSANQVLERPFLHRQSVNENPPNPSPTMQCNTQLELIPDI